MSEEKKGAHNMTETERNELQYHQQMGTMPMVKANLDEDYEIPAHEQHMIHAEIEIKQFDGATGAKTSVPKVQTFYPKEFKEMDDSGGFKGYSVKIVHNPEAGVSKPADKKNAKDTNKPLTAKQQKELDKKNAKELPGLLEEYKSLYGEDADAALSNEELKELIDLKAGQQ